MRSLVIKLLPTEIIKVGRNKIILIDRRSLVTMTLTVAVQRDEWNTIM